MAVKKFTKPQASRRRAKPNRRRASSKIHNQPFPIVAIGASAGGLKAFVG
jgi:chemotaxis response regulator CheB